MLLVGTAAEDADLGAKPVNPIHRGVRRGTNDPRSFNASEIVLEHFQEGNRIRDVLYDRKGDHGVEVAIRSFSRLEKCMLWVRGPRPNY